MQKTMKSSLLKHKPKISGTKAVKSPAKTSSRKVPFRFAAAKGSRVFVAGTFNAWSPNEHELAYHDKNGVFRVALALAPGRYEYKFVANGAWIADPTCRDWAPNEHGSFNSVIVV